MLLPPASRVDEESVPHVRPSRHHLQGPAFARTSDHDRRSGSLGRFRLTAGVVQREVRPLEVDGIFGEKAGDDLGALLEPVHSLLHGSKVQPVGVCLGLEPSSTQSEIQPSSGHDIEGRRHIRRHRRVTEVHPVDHRSNAQP